jgi:hypothetical protein
MDRHPGGPTPHGAEQMGTHRIIIKQLIFTRRSSALYFQNQKGRKKKGGTGQDTVKGVGLHM